MEKGNMTWQQWHALIGRATALALSAFPTDHLPIHALEVLKKDLENAINDGAGRVIEEYYDLPDD